MNDNVDRAAEDRADVEAMLAAQAGRLEPFEGLVRRHQQPLVNFFRRLCVDSSSDVQDMAQLTLVRLFQHRARYRPTARFTTFLYTVARNVFIDAMRRRNRGRELVEDLVHETPGSDDGGMGRMRLRMDVREGLLQLSEKLRCVVVLAVYRGMRYEEIAEVLGIPVGTVKSRMFQAMEQLKEILSDLDGR